MKIHEYQAKEILKNNAVEIPVGFPAFSVDEAVTVAEKIGGKLWVVKAQIHAGGRGKGGGVKIAKSINEVKLFAQQILGMKLITHQTSPEGQEVKRLFIEEGIEIINELYAGIVLDRAKEKFVFMVSTEGGVEIEKIAESNPEKIIKVWIEPEFGLTTFQARKLAFALNLEGNQIKNGIKMFKSLWKAFDANDCSIAEINPLVITTDDKVIALDAKMNFDDNSIFRHPEILELRDLNEEDPAEIEASKHDLSYIKLDGNIGCMVNGAGLAMATMDIIKLYGEEPANFLDVGGGASKAKVSAAFKLILSDKNVKGILINIFGGIMRCDVLAQGVIDAAKEIKINVPIVVRLAGTNFEEGKKILDNSGLEIISASDLSDAAQKIVKEIK